LIFNFVIPISVVLVDRVLLLDSHLIGFGLLPLDLAFAVIFKLFGCCVSLNFGLNLEHIDAHPAQLLCSDSEPQTPHNGVNPKHSDAGRQNLRVVHLTICIVFSHNTVLRLVHDAPELQQIYKDAHKVHFVRYGKVFGVNGFCTEDQDELALGKEDCEQIGQLVLLLAEAGGG